MNTLLISLHPRHSKNIFDNKKIIELRKRKPRTDKNLKLLFDRILIYETTPTSQIVGYCQAVYIQGVLKADTWGQYQKDLCLSQTEILDYLGDRKGYGIRLRKPQKIAPIPLSKMREVGILPPQGYRYLTDADLEKLGVIW